MSREDLLEKIMRCHTVSLELLARGRTCSELKHNDELGSRGGAAHAYARLQYKHHEPAADAAEPQRHNIFVGETCHQLIACTERNGAHQAQRYNGRQQVPAEALTSDSLPQGSPMIRS